MMPYASADVKMHPDRGAGDGGLHVMAQLALWLIRLCQRLNRVVFLYGEKSSYVTCENLNRGNQLEISQYLN